MRECDAINYFGNIANVELTIGLLHGFNEAKANDYFGSLDQKITNEGLTEITFQERNDVFLSNVDCDIFLCEINKRKSGFNYKLKLPKKLN